MDTDMNDMVSPSQSSPSMSGGAGQNKGNTGAENTTVVSFLWKIVCLHIDFEHFLLFYSAFNKT
jgi:hypothetical protein